ncbi:MAG: hypothetical protein U0800_00355 [Isosphaeraceae bacterium]
MILGHLQRGGRRAPYDRVLATRLGLGAAELVISKDFGKMVALKGTQIIATSLESGVAASQRLDLNYYQEASVFFS